MNQTSLIILTLNHSLKEESLSLLQEKQIELYLEFL
jgi:hypothetical protein